MLTVLEVIRKTTDFFAAKSIDSPRLNAELIVGHVLALNRMQLYLQFERLLTNVELEVIRPLVRRRSLREPLQYILGEADFFGVRLKVDRRALIPRPETEQLVELVTGRCVPSPGAILDLGTGSGAIALGLARYYPLAQVTAVDASLEAISLAQENAAAAGLTERVTLLHSSWFDAVPSAARYDLIIGNPPYLSVEEVAETAPEVRGHEPVEALVSDDGGVADLKLIVEAAPRYLESGGMVALETGIAQHGVMAQTATTAGFHRTESLPDLSGRDRFMLFWRE